MSVPRLLVTGGSGQVGGAVVRLAASYGFAAEAPTRSALDLRTRAGCQSYSLAGIAAIINCAAYTAVDKAEGEQAAAFAINADGPRLLASLAAAANIPFIHVSTDYVFDGRKRAAYDEDDTPSPLGIYGASKLAGERGVIASGARHAIVRTAWVVSAGGANFIHTMLRLSAERAEVSVVDDQFGCPTSADDLAEALLAIARRKIASECPSGIWNFVNAGRASWYDLAAYVFKRAATAGLKTPTLTGIPTSAYPTPAARPANSELSTLKFIHDFGYVPRHWQCAVDDILDARLLGVDRDEGHHIGRRIRHTAPSGYARNQQATAADLRQADDLLSDVGAAHGGHS